MFPNAVNQLLLLSTGLQYVVYCILSLHSDYCVMFHDVRTDCMDLGIETTESVLCSMLSAPAVWVLGLRLLCLCYAP